MLTHCLHCKAWDPAPDRAEGHCRRLSPMFLQGEIMDPEDRAAEARRERTRTGLDVIYLDRAVWPRTAADDSCCDGYPKDPDECQPLPDRVVVPARETSEEALERIKQEDNRGEQWRDEPPARSERKTPHTSKPGPKPSADSLKERIAAVLFDATTPLSAAEIAAQLDAKPASVCCALSQNKGTRFEKLPFKRWKLAGDT